MKIICFIQKSSVFLRLCIFSYIYLRLILKSVLKPHIFKSESVYKRLIKPLCRADSLVSCGWKDDSCKNMYFHKYPDSCERCLSRRPHVSRYFWIRNFFFADTASVHTYPENPAEKSANFLIRTPEWKFLNTLWIRNRVDAKSGYLFFQWRNKIEPSSLPWILYLRWQPRSQVLSLTRRGDW